MIQGLIQNLGIRGKVVCFNQETGLNPSLHLIPDEYKLKRISG